MYPVEQCKEKHTEDNQGQLNGGTARLPTNVDHKSVKNLNYGVAGIFKDPVRESSKRALATCYAILFVDRTMMFSVIYPPRRHVR